MTSQISLPKLHRTCARSAPWALNVTPGAERTRKTCSAASALMKSWTCLGRSVLHHRITVKRTSLLKKLKSFLNASVVLHRLHRSTHYLVQSSEIHCWLSEIVCPTQLFLPLFRNLCISYSKQKASTLHQVTQPTIYWNGSDNSSESRNIFLQLPKFFKIPHFKNRFAVLYGWTEKETQ